MTLKPSKAHLKTPLGTLEISGDSREIVSIAFTRAPARVSKRALPGVVRKCLRELEAYFKGSRRRFSFKIKVDGTDFERKVLRELPKISYGRTLSYGAIARRIGVADGARAVARVVAKNKALLGIPCHRVIGSRGQLAGYSAGLAKKSWLLNHEQ